MQIKKLAASALGSLMAGATLAFPAAAATLEDFPTPFIEDGEAEFSMIVGEDAATADVVGAIDMAVTMGGQPTIEEMIEVKGTAATWSATDGITLNRPNRHLYLDSKTNAGIDGLVEGDLGILDTQVFEDGDEDEITVEHEIAVEEMSQEFGSKTGMDEINLYIDLQRGKTLFSFDAYFDNEVNFTHEDLENEEVEMFGRIWEVSEDTDETTLVLYGDSEMFDVEYQDPVTRTIGDEEATFEVLNVPDHDEALLRVAGTLRSVEEGDTIRVHGVDVRIREIFNLPDEDGIVQFGIGSEEMELTHGSEVEIDGDSVDGTNVVVEDSADVQKFETTEVISIEFHDLDRTERFIEAGDKYVDPVFGIEFHYGGASPNAAEDPAETLFVEADGDIAELTMTDDSGDTADITFMSDDDSEVILGNWKDVGGHIMTYEGQEMGLEDYIILNEDEHAVMYEVSDLWYDDEDDEGEIELENVFTGDVRLIEFEDEPTETERINRISYDFSFDTESDDPEKATFNVIWGDELVVYPGLYTDTDAAVAFFEDVVIEDVNSSNDTVDVRFPSTKSSGDQVKELDVSSDDLEYSVEVGGIEYNISVTDTGDELTITPAEVSDFGLGVIQPEDNNDDEHAMIITPDPTVEEIDFDADDIRMDTESGFEWASFEEIDDLEATYSFFGTYLELDTDDDGELEINLPQFEATVGMAMTDPDGSLDAAAVAEEATYDRIVPIIDPVGKLDTEVVDEAAEDHLVLIGGPAVNELHERLAQEHEDVRTLDEWEDEWFDADTGQWERTSVIQLVEDAFADGQSALIVAGTTREETRAATTRMQTFKEDPFPADMEYLF